MPYTKNSSIMKVPTILNENSSYKAKTINYEWSEIFESYFGKRLHVPRLTMV